MHVAKFSCSMLFSSYFNQKWNLANLKKKLDCEILRTSSASRFRPDRRMDVSIRFANAPNETLKNYWTELTCEYSNGSRGPTNDRKFTVLAE